MQWKELLRSQIEFHYMVAGKLIEHVGDNELNWKPTIGNNWMNMGQLLRHLDSACGGLVKGFVTGDWGLPPDFDITKMKFEDMIQPVDQLQPVTSIADAKARLASDKKMALEYLDKCTEEELTTRMVRMPFAPVDMPLGQTLLNAVNHLDHHKDQLYYYLKMQGKPVHSGHLFGM